MLKPVFALIMLVLILSVISLQANAGTEVEFFKEGVSAFKKGDYPEARKAFEKARNEGLDSASLHYNLGVTYYRLGEYDNAATEFELLTDEAKWKNLAYYNLGLVAEKKGLKKKAKDYYQRALSQQESKVNTLASRALSRLAGPRSTSYLFASLFAGSDDNVTLVPDQEAAGSEDNQLTGFITGRYYLDRQWSLEGLLYGRRYEDSSEFNTSLAEVGLHREHGLGKWRWDNAVNVSLQSLDGERYLDTASLETEAQRSLSGKRAVKVGGELSGIRAADGFDYLEGWRARGKIRWLQGLGSGQLQLDYRLELNDREDLVAGEDFASFSPIRHLIKTDYSFPFSRRWAGRASVAYQHSDYRDDHIIQGETIHRKDNRLMASLRADVTLTPRWRLFGEYRHTDNSSTIDIYDYDRNEWSLGLEYFDFY
ncbi:MAG: tetratricopeptide repeat protein [Alcanivorax sp.]|jgi:tetratricopeptide (TPR) repeat protein|uniref:tetratricopeptide repeat protein n=1 Tax=Alcanivorax sp. TaxID=1872427 RepID=UPI002621646E|nr:tetratricopeptide repeat protein [Alcanivorax sp.]MDF1723780.1 tetratricopeptide repeat protein [Alcanivorax sp.]